MSIIPVIDNEYLYKLKLFYRKSIPSNDIFYLVFFLVKFFPILLFTHAVDFNNDKNQFTLSKIIKASLLFNHSVTISYVSLCCVVYVILLLLLLSFLYVFLYFYFKAKTTDYQLYGIPSNKIEISKRVKYIFKFTCYLYVSPLLNIYTPFPSFFPLLNSPQYVSPLAKVSNPVPSFRSSFQLPS